MNRVNEHSMTRRGLSKMVLGGLAASCLPIGVARADDGPGALTFASGNLDAMFSAGFVALKNGYFKEAGLDAKYMDGQNGPRARQMLAAGQVQIVASASFDPAVIWAAGKRTKVIAGIDERLPYANVVVRKEDMSSGRIRKFSDLAGKRIAVTAPKSAFWLMATQMVDAGGVKSVELRSVGDPPSMLAALKSKQVDAVMATVAMMEGAEKEGWGAVLVSIRNPAEWQKVIGLGGDVQGQWIYTLEEFAAARPAAVQAFVKGWVKGHDFVMANKASTVTDLIYADYLNPFKKETVLESIAFLQERVWSKDNMITPADYQRVMKVMAGDRLISSADAAKMPYESAVDMSFVRKARGK
jgi:NitT/TauT family transport system substrate-binding protein